MTHIPSFKYHCPYFYEVSSHFLLICNYLYGLDVSTLCLFYTLQITALGLSSSDNFACGLYSLTIIHVSM